jgi:hypothetical protein
VHELATEGIRDEPHPDRPAFAVRDQGWHPDRAGGIL